MTHFKLHVAVKQGANFSVVAVRALLVPVLIFGCTSFCYFFQKMVMTTSTSTHTHYLPPNNNSGNDDDDHDNNSLSLSLFLLLLSVYVHNLLCWHWTAAAADTTFVAYWAVSGSVFACLPVCHYDRMSLLHYCNSSSNSKQFCPCACVCGQCVSINVCLYGTNKFAACCTTQTRPPPPPQPSWDCQTKENRLLLLLL